MKDQLLHFIDVIQNEIEKFVVPDPGTEVARNTSILAARQLRRLLVEEIEMPPLRRAALVSYGELLPPLRQAVDGKIYDRLNQVLAVADIADWKQVESVLYEVMAALLLNHDEASHKLAGQLAAIDARLRESKELACLERGKVKTSRSAPKPPAVGSEEQQARLLDFVKRQFPRETTLKIAGIKQIPGGFSKHTLFIDLANNRELPDCIVMRRDGPFAGTSVVTEYPIIQKMHAAGVAVPRPYAIDAAGEVYGKPFILMSRAAGVIIGDFIVVREPSREVALDLAKKMARLHAAPFVGLETALDGGMVSITERLTAELEACEAMWQSVVNQNSYVVQAAIDWLKRNIHLADGPRAVVHRDIGAHNMLVCNGEVSAFLDWETVAIGTPAEDIAYVYYTATQMIAWEDFLAAYEAEAGTTLDRRPLDYYTLWGSLRILVPICKNVDPVFSGTRKSLPDYYLGDQIAQVLIQRIAAKLSQVLS